MVLSVLLADVSCSLKVPVVRLRGQRKREDMEVFFFFGMERVQQFRKQTDNAPPAPVGVCSAYLGTSLAVYQRTNIFQASGRSGVTVLMPSFINIK